MAEFLHRRINVAIPEVDVGDDVFVVKGSDESVVRVQVKSATATDQQNSYVGRFVVPEVQLAMSKDSPPLVYVFALRRGNRWTEFVVIRRATLFARRTEGAGYRQVDAGGTANIEFRITFRPDSALCGPGNGVDFHRYRDAWDPWPPPRVEEEGGGPAPTGPAAPAGQGNG
jgi:hypothetical protein